MSEPRSVFVAVRVTGGQEVNSADVMEKRIRTHHLPIKAILVPEGLKGYILLEVEAPHHADAALVGVKHVRSRIMGVIPFSEVERYLVVKPVIEELAVGKLVEVVGGPLKGSKARVIRVDYDKKEAVIELMDVGFTFPITVPADYLKVLEGS